MIAMSTAPSDQELYDELAFYTLELRDPEFIHQHIVDAFAVQHAGPDSKPIAIVFGLLGLYLYLEKNFTGARYSALTCSSLAAAGSGLRRPSRSGAPFSASPMCSALPRS